MAADSLRCTSSQFSFPSNLIKSPPLGAWWPKLGNVTFPSLIITAKGTWWAGYPGLGCMATWDLSTASILPMSQSLWFGYCHQEKGAWWLDVHNTGGKHWAGLWSLSQALKTAGLLRFAPDPAPDPSWPQGPSLHCGILPSGHHGCLFLRDSFLYIITLFIFISIY
jgi:hypothetical protein